MKLYIYCVLVILLCILAIYIASKYNRESFEESSVGLSIDAILPRPRPENLGEIIIFNKNKWLLYDMSIPRVIMGPYNLSHHAWFKGLPDGFDHIGAAVPRPSDPERELIFFKDNKWLLWDFPSDSLSGGPYTILESKWFRELPQQFGYQINATCLEPTRPKTHILFFKDHQWLIWDFANDKIEGGPYNLGLDSSPNFKTLPKSFRNGIDIAFINPRFKDEIYLFAGVNWLIWNYKIQKVTMGPLDLRTSPIFQRMSRHFLEMKEDTTKTYISMDKSGKGYHAELYNVEYVSNIPKIKSNFDRNAYDMYKTGKSVRLNGRNAYMEIQDIKDLYKNGFSFALFFRLTEYISIPRKDYILANCVGDFNWQLLVNKNGYLEFKTRLANTSMWTSLFSKEKINNEWYHVTVCHDHNEQHMFLNEEHFKKNDIIRVFPPNPTSIFVGAGGIYPNLENYFDGLIGEIRVYNRVLNQDEVCKINPMCPVLEEVEAPPPPPPTMGSCVFTPKGLREIDCLSLCKNESTMNNCNINQCLSLCSNCNDPSNCTWLQPPELYKPEQKPDVTNTKKCQFRPYGMSVQHCSDVCSGKDRVRWGGTKCDNRECHRICSNCKDDYCQWIKEKKDIQKTIPSKPRMEAIPGDNEIVLYWNRPNDGNDPIKNYIIIYYETQTREKKMNVPVVDCSSNSCHHTLENLKNNTYYSIGVAAVNSIGMGNLSNIEVISPGINLPKLSNTLTQGQSTDTVVSSNTPQQQTLSSKEVPKDTTTSDSSSSNLNIEDLSDDKMLDLLQQQTKESSKDDLLYSASGQVEKDWLTSIMGKTIDLNLKF